MYIKQINARKALELASKGEDIMVMVSRDGGTDWMDYSPMMLGDMLDGCMFFQQDIIPEKKLPSESRKNTRGVELDMGKVLALKKAGWSNEKIAEEMGVNTRTIIYRLKAQ